ncbi:MAG: nucleotidyltransferase [Candidatus Omnitrophica bacterium]|nr:nucleotidyltransferase [Candidatus Omnitrophota bacterium]
MNVHSDYEDLFKVLNAYDIKYLLIGAYAVMYYAQPRYTKDIDVWIIPELNDVQKIYNALKEFGAPLKRIKPEDFNDNTMIFQIGIAPVRIDIMTDLPGVSAKFAWRNKKRIRYGKTPVYVLGKEELVVAKKKAGRPQDGIDLEKLK